MVLGQQGVTSYYPLTPIGFGLSTVTGNNNQKEDDSRAKELAHEARVKKAQEEFLKRIELIQAKAVNDEIVKNLKKQEEETKKALEKFEKTKSANGSATIDSGQTGIVRWLSNSGTSIVNMGKSIAGFDEKWNWDAGKCLKNAGITALAIGATFIPYVGPVIGYGLLAYGVIGGTVGVAKGVSKLEEAEQSGDQRKIDEAQQDICSNAFIGVTSAFGLKGIGKAFRTSTATAEMASSATARTSLGGKCVESVSNLGRDITVNAFKATKHSAKNGITPSLGGFRSWDKQYNKQLVEYEQSLTNEIQKIDDLISTTTKNEELALLFEKRALLVKNQLEFQKYASLKSKTDIDNLISSNAKTASQQNIERLQSYTTDASGSISLPGGNINAQQFATFQRKMINLQKAYDKSFRNLIKTKENMMRTFAAKPKKHKTQLDEYISTTGVKRHKWMPGHWLRNDYELALGDKNPSYGIKSIGTMFTAPASNVAKASGAWVSPIYSDAMLLTAELSPEETKAQIEAMETAINGLSSLREKMENAETIEEFNSAMAEYKQLVAATNGEQQESAQSEEQKKQ